MLDALLEIQAQRDRRDEAGEGAAACSESGEELPVSTERPSSLTWGKLPARLEVSGVDAPWAPGERRELKVELENTGFARWLAGGCPEGGVALQVRLLLPGLSESGGPVDLREKEPWLPLPRSIEPGESHTFHVAVRRPPGASRLIIEPHVIGGSALRSCRWESWLS
jgi:hypothetical protein